MSLNRPRLLSRRPDSCSAVADYDPPLRKLIQSDAFCREHVQLLTAATELRRKEKQIAL